jgi:lipopolysaccharide export system permease protein
VVTLVAVMASGMSDMKNYNATLPQLFMVQLLTMPVKIQGTLIISIVTASIVTMVLLMRSKEMLAYVSIGGRIGRILVPFVIVACMGAGLYIMFERSLYTHFKNARARYISEEIRGGTYQGASARLTDMWMIDNNKRLIHADLIDPETKLVTGITEYTISKDFQVESIQLVEQAQYQDGQWVLTGVYNTNLLDVPPHTIAQETITMKSTLLDDITSMSGQSRKQMEYDQLVSMIGVLKQHGLSATPYEMRFYAIYATALSAIVLVILVVPMGIDFSRRYSPLKSSVSSFALALAFWGSYSACESFGFSDILPPFLATFLPLMVFLCLGGAILVWKERVR